MEIGCYDVAEFPVDRMRILCTDFWSYTYFDLVKNDFSGQIISTSHDLTPNGDLGREIPLFQGNLAW